MSFMVLLAALIAPDFSLKSLDGRTVHLNAFRGKVVVLNFWATWCAGCKVEMPRLSRLYRARRGAGLEIIGVSMDDAGDAAVARFVKAQRIDYPIVRGNDAVAAAFGGARLLPQTFLIDRNGAIVKRIVGVPDERELRAVIDVILRM